MTEPSLHLIELFTNIQGETSFTGLPTTFIRLAKCNLRCSWCDTTYSFGKGTETPIEEILEKVRLAGFPHVCVTGGEPLLQKNVHILMKSLADEKYIISLETSGSLPIHNVDSRVHIILDIKCPGSLMDHKNHIPNIEILTRKDEVKFVLADRKDYEFAKNISYQHNLFNEVKDVLFSPVFGKLDPQALISWIIEDHLPVRLNLQMHKFIWGAERKGV